MDNTFYQFCTCTPADYSALKRQVDRCASLGRSYEFPHCTMPEGSIPPDATVGFWRDNEGYAIYTAPRVAFLGGGPATQAFFSASMERFHSFEALALFMQAMGKELSSCGSGFPPLYHTLYTALSQHVTGQDAALEAVAFKLCGHIRKKAPARPLSLIFYGPTGVGKSELGKCIAPVLSQCGGDPYAFVWTELNTFSEPHSVYRLTGAPPGYAGYDDPPVFEAVLKNPKTVFMFDELDKAHPEILKVFMSLLDEGRCSARRAEEESGRMLDFRQCVLLFTTNAVLSERRSMGFQTGAPSAPLSAPPSVGASSSMAVLARRMFAENERARHAFTQQGALREIAGRFGGFIGFQPLSPQARADITVKQIAALGREYGLHITQVAPSLVAEVQAALDGALSVRSSVSMLEGCLTALFLSSHSRQPLLLDGTLQAPRLLPISSESGLESQILLPA